MKNEKYKIVMSKFIGYGSTGSATYEITFNKSLEHTGRFTGIEDGLNAYCKKERRKEIVEILKHLLCLLLNKNEKYEIVMSKFIGYGSTGYARYEITFNKSLEHTGRFTGIEDGLNDYCRKERRKEIVESLKHLLCLLLNKNENKNEKK